MTNDKHFFFRFVTWGSTLNSHALSAVRILHTVSQCPLVQPKLVGLLSGSPDKELLLHGFVECLEAEGDDEEDEQEEEEIKQQGIVLVYTALFLY